MSSYSRLFKGVSMFVLVSAYVGMFLYVLWFGSQETDKIQIALCQSFLFWLFLEVFIYDDTIIIRVDVIFKKQILRVRIMTVILIHCEMCLKFLYASAIR